MFIQAGICLVRRFCKLLQSLDAHMLEGMSYALVKAIAEGVENIESNLLHVQSEKCFASAHKFNDL